MKLTPGENRKYSQKVKSSEDIYNIRKILNETVVNFEISQDIPWDREKQFKSGLMSYFRHCGFIVDVLL